MGHGISLHAKEVKDEEEEALLHIQAPSQASAQQPDPVPAPDSPRQIPNA